MGLKLGDIVLFKRVKIRDYKTHTCQLYQPEIQKKVDCFECKIAELDLVDHTLPYKIEIDGNCEYYEDLVGEFGDYGFWVYDKDLAKRVLNNKLTRKLYINKIVEKDEDFLWIRLN